MLFAVTETVAPAELAVSLARAKEHLKVAGTDEDALITEYLKGAIEDAESECGRRFVTATLRLTLDDFPRARDEDGCGIIRLPVGPVQSVASITYTDTAGATQTVASGDYSVGAKTARVKPVAGWPATKAAALENVAVNYVAGYGAASAVPARAVLAILLILADRYTNRGDELSSFHANRPIPAGALRLLRNLSDGEQW